MPFRRSAAAVLFALALVSGCKDVTQEPAPNEIVVAAFHSQVLPNGACASPLDPRCTDQNVPTPNDLAMQAEPLIPAVAPMAAQKAMLREFVAAGGFANDQAIGISIPIKRAVWDAASNQYVLTTTPPTVDPATLTTSGAAPNFVLLKIDVNPPQVITVQLDPANTVPGQIALQKPAAANGSRAWAPGRYVFAMRGGAAGVKTSTGAPIGPDQGITLVALNSDLTNPDNRPSSLSQADADQLDGVRKSLWNPVTWGADGTGHWNVTGAGLLAAYPAVSAYIPAGEVSIIATFQVAPVPGAIPGVPAPMAPIDQDTGLVPLPIDLLRTANSGTTIAYNSAFGPAAAGLTTLDGFSTTGTIFAPVTVPIDAGTVNGATVQLFKISGTGAPRPLRELKALLGSGGDPLTAEWVAQPDPLNVASGIQVAPGFPCQKTTGCSLAVGAQAGVPAPVTLLGATFYLPPLEEETDYAVVITTAVKDVFGRQLQKSTIAKMLVDPGFDPIATSSVNGTSYVPGVPDVEATALWKMRLQLAKVVEALPNGASDVALAWTFHTQSIAETSVQLSVAPYGIEEGAGAPVFLPAAASTTAPPGSYTNVAAFYSVTIPSLDAIDKTTGALDPVVLTTTNAATILAHVHPLQALVAVPAVGNPNIPSCPSAPAYKCAPLVVFGHGLGGKKEDMLSVVDSLAAKGFAVAAFDFPQHGARSWCFKSSDCDDGGVDGTCTAFTGGLGQGDVDPGTGLPIAPGVCTVGVPKAAISGQTFVSANFFRTRDALRQNLIDQAALVLALARPPSPLYPIQPGSPDAFQMAVGTDPNTAGVVVDPGHVYWEGISLGGIAGTEVLATNPRFSHGVTSVAGGTLVDVFTSPLALAFTTRVNALFSALLKPQLDAIAPGTPFSHALVDGTSPSFNALVAAQYLKTLVTAKWILDPGDPLNYAAHLRTSPLPNLLANPNGTVLQSPKDVLGQVAIGDIVVPNPFNRELFTIGNVRFVEYTSSTYPPANMHGILSFDPTVQSQAASWLFDLTAPPAPPTQVTIP